MNGIIAPTQQLYKPPFPWYGGKSRAAELVWDRLGPVGNYVEPFFCSGAVLFLRPDDPKTETVNDEDAYLANFWRAVQADPEAVAHHADWPVNEVDLIARNRSLIALRDDFRQRMVDDPEHCDAKLAGWWVWGQSAWIGSGWATGDHSQIPHLGNAGKGVNRLPHLGDAGQGVNRLPHLGNAGQGVNHLTEYLAGIADRLRFVRVCCGDWMRVLGPSVTFKHGITGVFLDPPYSAEAERDGNLYAEEDLTVAHAVREWAIANGSNPKLRIALCGYDGEHAMPDEWRVEFWKANGGYANRGNGKNQNKHRECIWFSPHCLIEEKLF